MFKQLEGKPSYITPKANYLVPISTSGDLQGFSYILSSIVPEFKEVYKKALRSGRLNKRHGLTVTKESTNYHLIPCSQKAGNFKPKMLEENLVRFFKHLPDLEKITVISKTFEPISESQLKEILLTTCPTGMVVNIY